MKTRNASDLRFASLVLASILVGLWLAAGLAVAQGTNNFVVPHLIKFSGVVKDDAGQPKTGVSGITFALYKDEQGGAPLWLETQNVQADVNGRYTVLLGATKSDGLPMEFFGSNEARWVGVRPEGQGEQPRVLLVSAPYALKAGDAETLGGKPASAFVLSTPGSGSTATADKIGASGTSINGNTASAAVTGTGTPNHITKWKTTTQLENAGMFETPAGNVGIGTVSPGAALDVEANNPTAAVLGKNSSAGASSAGVVGETGTAKAVQYGVLGVNSSTGSFSAGVRGESPAFVSISNIGVEGDTNSTGALSAGVEGRAQALTGLTYGVEGLTFSASNSAAGVFGEAFATGGKTFGVQGQNSSVTDGAAGLVGWELGFSGKTFGSFFFESSPNGTATYSQAITESATAIGLLGCCPIGVWGDTGSSAGGAAGLVGTADDARAIYLQNNSPSGVPTAFVLNTENTTHNLPVFTEGGAFGSCFADTDGNLGCTGNITAHAPVAGGKRQVALYAMESPQNWFEDFGSGQLASGTARISLDATFAETVNTGVTYHVFLTPRDECEGLYASNATASGFEVHELHRGHSNVAFDYRIVALRRGQENVRLEDVTDRQKKAQALQPQVAPGQRLTLPAPTKREARVASLQRCEPLRTNWIRRLPVRRGVRSGRALRRIMQPAFRRFASR